MVIISSTKPFPCRSLQPPLLGHGQGRLSVLNQPVTVATAIEKMKAHLGLTHLRLALGLGKTLGNDLIYTQQAILLLFKVKKRKITEEALSS